MSLLGLPPELLEQIIDRLGSSYFRQDSRRLTVCKDWFAFAHHVFYKDLQLSPETLQQLFLSSHVSRKIPQIQNRLEILDLKLNRLKNWGIVVRHIQQTLELIPKRNRNESITRQTMILDNNVARLATVAKNSRKLRVVRIQALYAINLRSPPSLIYRDYLSLSTVQALLSVKTLTVLELDLRDIFPTPQQEHHGDSHFCPSIGALLLTLKRLRLRTRIICADCLKPPHHDTSLRLSEVIVNLSQNPMERPVPCGAVPFRCFKPISVERADIEDQAKALVGHMASPKIVRVQTDSLKEFEMESLDVLTGKRMTLAEGIEWTDDGKTVEEGNPYSDLESRANVLSTTFDEEEL